MLSRGKFPLFLIFFVMRGLDPRICRWREMAGSSPGHDVLSVVIRGLDPRIGRWRETAASSFSLPLGGRDV
jgi:hypothetical protein